MKLESWKNRSLSLIYVLMGIIYCYDALISHRVGATVPHEGWGKFFCVLFFLHGTSPRSPLLLYSLALVFSGVGLWFKRDAGFLMARIISYAIFVNTLLSVVMDSITLRCLPDSAWWAGGLIPVVLAVVTLSITPRKILD